MYGLKPVPFKGQTFSAASCSPDPGKRLVSCSFTSSSTLQTQDCRRAVPLAKRDASTCRRTILAAVLGPPSRPAGTRRVWRLPCLVASISATEHGCPTSRSFFARCRIPPHLDPQACDFGSRATSGFEIRGIPHLAKNEREVGHEAPLQIRTHEVFFLFTHSAYCSRM